MGFINTHAFSCSIVDQLKREWNGLVAWKQEVQDQLEVTTKGNRPWTDTEVMVNNLMLQSENAATLVEYLPIVLKVLMKYNVMVKLKKCRFFASKTEFVGIDIKAKGNKPAKSKVRHSTTSNSTHQH